MTVEALAVTFLTRVINRLNRGQGSPALRRAERVLRAANASEQDHYRVLRGLGFRPLATRFWIPHSFFGTNLGNVARTLEFADTRFVNAYLIGVTVFAKNGQPNFARYAAEICGVEAEHRALARSLQGKLPNNVGFEGFYQHNLNDIVALFVRAGVGFGQRGSRPGQFYTFRGTGDAVVPILNHNPR